VADALDAMMTDRPYRKALSMDKAIPPSPREGRRNSIPAWWIA
jgi:hypothetical protein